MPDPLLEIKDLNVAFDTDRALSNRVLEGAYTWVEAGVIDQSEGTGPWIATWEPGASKAENVHRSYR